MKYRKVSVLFLSFVLISGFSGCGKNTEGNYTQISSANTSSDTGSILSSVSSTESETVADTSSNDFYEDIGDGIPDDTLVPISDYISGVKIDLKYASTDNFTKKKIYDFSVPYLRYGTVKKLKAVQNELKTKGYELLIYDAYRPTSAQDKLWEVCPNPKYVSDPSKGYTNHCRGNTVDVTLIKTDGTAVIMPSEFDEFSELADRDYSDVSKEAAGNSQSLEDIMIKYGFKPYHGEWWHYTDTVIYDIVEK